MNLFIIPSWYPTPAYPSTGIFFKEQAKLIARQHPDWNVGISLWGSHFPELWISPRRPADMLRKLILGHRLKESVTSLDSGATAFFSPAFTWTRKFRGGNIGGIIRANRRNLERFTETFGPPHVIMAYVSHPGGYIARKLAQESKIPFVIAEHMVPFPMEDYRKDYRKWIIEPLKYADLVLSVSESLASRLASFSVRSEVMPNFIDEMYFRPAPGSSGKMTSIFALGRLEHQKGFDLLLRAMSKVEGDWALRIGGEGGLSGQLKNIAVESGVERRVQWLGELTREQVRDEMQACDFFVLSSRFESFGVVLVEAMACGKPVVATACGGPLEIVSEETGILCEPEVLSLATAISAMCRQFRSFDPKKIRDHFMRKFSSQAGVRLLEKYLRSVARSPGNHTEDTGTERNL